ncbi:MAG: hypothetical protein HZB16_20190 [Armatimonadetes bacterium]|nr:hypothetical protein [Armatimonadota bacterium]
MPRWVRRCHVLAAAIAAPLLLSACRVKPLPKTDGPVPPLPSAMATASTASTAPAPPPAAAAPSTATTEVIPAPDSTTWQAEVAARVDQVRNWLQRTQRGGVLLADARNVAWLTLGGSMDAGPGRPAGCLAVLPDRVLVVAPNDVVDALRAPFRALDWNGRTYRWDLGSDAAAPARAVRPLLGTRPLASDIQRAGTDYCADELAELRRRLSGGDAKRLAWLTRTGAQTVATTLAAAGAEQTERKVAASLTSALADKGLNVDWLRVTALDRLDRDGLAAAGDDPVRGGAAVQIVVSRWGLRSVIGRTFVPGTAGDVSDYVTAGRLYGELLGRATVGTPLAGLYRAAEKAASDRGVADAFARSAPGGLGAYDPAALPIGPDSVATIGAGDVLVLAIRLPRAYLAETFWFDEAAQRASAGAAVPTLIGAEQAVTEAQAQANAAESRLRGADWLGKVLTGAVNDARANGPRREAAKPAPAASEATTTGSIAPPPPAAPAPAKAGAAPQ